MLSSAGRIETYFVFTDRDKNEGRLRLSFSSSATPESLLSAYNSFIGVVTALSDATIKRVEERFIMTEYPPTTAPEGSDAQAYLCLYYTNSELDTQERIDIPSPKSSIFETTGDYAGIRLNVDYDMQLMLEALVVGLVTPENTTFPPIFDIGGISL